MRSIIEQSSAQLYMKGDERKGGVGESFSARNRVDGTRVKIRVVDVRGQSKRRGRFFRPNERLRGLRERGLQIQQTDGEPQPLAHLLVEEGSTQPWLGFWILTKAECFSKSYGHRNECPYSSATVFCFSCSLKIGRAGKRLACFAQVLSGFLGASEYSQCIRQRLEER